MERKYLVWFAGNRKSTEMEVIATSRSHARALFALHHDVLVSNYIQARLA